MRDLRGAISDVVWGREVDPAPFDKAFAEWERLAGLFAPEFLDRIEDVLDVAGEKPQGLIRCEGRFVTTDGARRPVVFLEPSDLLTEMLATLRVRAHQLYRDLVHRSPT